MKSNIAIAVLFLLLTLFCFAQQKKSTITGKPISADCKKAIPIVLNKNFTYGPTISPNGYGDVQEFASTNPITFEGEHNSAWYLLSITKSGELIFDIVPRDTTNDYDFLLYTYNDSTFCDKLVKGNLKPVRSNLSNIKKSLKGITGLGSNTNKNSIGEGLGIAYSKSIEVKKDEKYMLILDNVTPDGKGHTLVFSFLKSVEIKGNIVGSDSIPIVANVVLSDNKGNIVEETESNKSGEYNIKTKLKENQNYSLSYISEDTFVQSRSINTKELKESNVFPDIKTVLPKLKKGEKYKLGNINFYGGSPKLLPESYGSVLSLYKLMKKNKKMIVCIQGHVNAPYSGKQNFSNKEDHQGLSEERAKTIYNLLLEKGIERERMKTEGLSSSQMLYPHARNEFEQSANRRVEIKVVSIE